MKWDHYFSVCVCVLSLELIYVAVFFLLDIEKKNHLKPIFSEHKDTTLDVYWMHTTTLETTRQSFDQ